MSTIIFSNNPGIEIQRYDLSRAFIVVPCHLVDIFSKNSEGKRILDSAPLITIDDSHEAKSIQTTVEIWKSLLHGNATRRSLIVNLGGGTTSDVGGFAAACYMRGIDYINIPTTMLAAVDASVGGKTAVNLDGVKNVVGAFHRPVATIVSTTFFNTLSDSELLSGYGEMLKHALLKSEQAFDEILNISPRRLASPEALSVIKQSVDVKRSIVEADPQEQGLRKVLNLGHTAGHALESLMAEKGCAIPHGCAVAHGLLIELVLSHILLEFPSSVLQKLATCLKEHYKAIPVSCKDYPRLLSFMHHDKKNATAECIEFALLQSPGEATHGITASEKNIKTSLDIYRDLIGI